MAELFSIDIHTHILPENIPDFGRRFGYRGFIHLDHHRPGCARMMMDDKFFREVQANVWDPQVRMNECDAQRVHVQVLSTCTCTRCASHSVIRTDGSQQLACTSRKNLSSIIMRAQPGLWWSRWMKPRYP